MSQKDRTQVARLYGQGWRPTVLAQMFGVTDNVIVRIARRRGMPPQQPKKAAALRERWSGG